MLTSGEDTGLRIQLGLSEISDRIVNSTDAQEQAILIQEAILKAQFAIAARTDVGKGGVSQLVLNAQLESLGGKQILAFKQFNQQLETANDMEITGQRDAARTWESVKIAFLKPLEKYLTLLHRVLLI